MTQNLLAVCTIPPTSGVPRDSVVNTFAVKAVTPITGANGGDLTTLLSRFYNQSTSVGHSVSNYLSAELSRATGACTWDIYDVTGHEDGTAHGSPIFSDTMTLAEAANSAVQMPSECAIVVTLRGAGWQTALVDVPGGAPGPAGNTHPRARLSGRLYVGPLCDTANNSKVAGSGPAQVNPTVGTALLDAIQDVYDQLAAASESLTLCVWSRAASLFTGVTHAQVDNAFDTQRRRGQDATTRTTRALA